MGSNQPRGVGPIPATLEVHSLFLHNDSGYGADKGTGRHVKSIAFIQGRIILGESSPLMVLVTEATPNYGFNIYSSSPYFNASSAAACLLQL